MAASQMPLLLLALLILTASTSAEQTIHEILEQFGFPPGLLPDTVESYTLIPYARIATAYNVTLNSPCHVTYGSYDVYFDSKITLPFFGVGVRIINVIGVKLSGFGDVVHILVDGDSLRLVNYELDFDVSLDIKLFESIPTCQDPSSKLISQLPVTAATSAQQTIHEIFQLYGFPPGLLPNTVKSYTTIPYPRIAVAYAVTLKSPCHVKYSSYDVYFDSGIGLAFIWTGGEIRVLSGIKLFNQNVTGIQVYGDRLRLSNTNGFVIFLDAKLFESIPICEDTAGNPSSKLISQLPGTAA